MSRFWIVFVFLAAGSFAIAQQSDSSHKLAATLQLKLDHLQENAARSQPDPTPTVMTEEEINDYMASGRVKLPQGVKKVTFQGNSGMLTTEATIDFDEVRNGQRSSSPLQSLFSGVHTVMVESDASGNAREGKVHIRMVTLDGVEVPLVALQFFVNKYVTPKYPNVGLDSTFQLPERIDTAVIGYHKLTVTQK